MSEGHAGPEQLLNDDPETEKAVSEEHHTFATTEQNGGKKQMKHELNKEEMVKIAGGDYASAEQWLRGYMEYFGLSSRSEAFARMSPDEKMFYEKMLQWYEYDEYYNALDKG